MNTRALLISLAVIPALTACKTAHLGGDEPSVSDSAIEATAAPSEDVSDNGGNQENNREQGQNRENNRENERNRGGA